MSIIIHFDNNLKIKLPDNKAMDFSYINPEKGCIKWRDLYINLDRVLYISETEDNK